MNSPDQPTSNKSGAKIMIAVGIFLFAVALTATILFLMIQRGPLQT